MSNNPITTSGALAIIYAIKFNRSSGIMTLDLSVRIKLINLFFKYNFE